MTDGTTLPDEHAGQCQEKRKRGGEEDDDEDVPPMPEQASGSHWSFSSTQVQSCCHTERNPGPRNWSLGHELLAARTSPPIITAHHWNPCLEFTGTVMPEQRDAGR